MITDVIVTHVGEVHPVKQKPGLRSSGHLSFMFVVRTLNGFLHETRPSEPEAHAARQEYIDAGVPVM